MATRYKLDLKGFEKLKLEAREKLCNIIINDSKRYVPNRGGTLERSAYKRKKFTEIVYDTPYSQYLWHGKLMLAPNGSSWAKKGEKKHLTNIDLNFDKTINPNAGKLWVDRAKKENIHKWSKKLEYELRKK